MKGVSSERISHKNVVFTLYFLFIPNYLFTEIFQTEELTYSLC